MAVADSSHIQFAGRVAEYEHAAAGDSVSYRRRVFRWALLGYLAVPVFVVSACALLTFALIRGYEIWQATQNSLALIILLVAGLPALTATCSILLLHMRVQFAAPSGIPIVRDDAPALFRLTDEIRNIVGVGRIDTVYLSNDINAAAIQTPRWWIIGGYRNELIIGLPLMQALGMREFAAVLAHEFGHFSGEHGRMAAWFRRIHTIWARIGTEVEARPLLGFYILPAFSRWYAGRFFAHAVTFFRRNEFEADRIAERVTGKEALVSALIRVAVAGAYYQEEWDRLLEKARQDAVVPAHPFRQLGDRLPDAVLWPDAEAALDTAMTAKTDVSDTHPPLAERLAAIGADYKLPAPVEAPASELLGDFEARALQVFTVRWHAEEGKELAADHNGSRRRYARLRALDLSAERDELQLESALERGRLAHEVSGREAAIKRYENCVRWHRHDARGWLALGELLLEEGNHLGLDCLDKAVENDWRSALRAVPAARRFLEDRGDLAGAEAFGAHFEQHAESFRAMADERRVLQEHDRFLSPSLEASTIADLQAAAGQFGLIAEVFLVCKEPPTPFMTPCHTLLINPGRLGRFLMPAKMYARTANRQLEGVDGLDDVVVEIITRDTLWMADKAAGVADARIYKRWPF